MSIDSREFKIQDKEGKILSFSKRNTLWVMRRCWLPQDDEQWELLTELEVIMTVSSWIRDGNFVEVVK